MNIKTLAKQMSENDARIETMFLLGGIGFDDTGDIPSDLEDVFAWMEIEDFRRCFPGLPDDVVSEIEDHNYRSLMFWIFDEKRFGFFVVFNTPEDTEDPSWGCFLRHAVYDDSLDGAVQKAFDWVNERRKTAISRTSK